jgi:predicted nuclease of restriction endonuclease-like RecB superfamily
MPPAIIDLGELALRSNLLIAQALMARAFTVQISLEGNSRAVVRHAALRGLLCSVSHGITGDGAQLEVSGPFALFRRTLLYGRAAPARTIIREPEPIAVGGHLIFPDFAIHSRSDPARRWLLEIVGFWTPEYLAQAPATARGAGPQPRPLHRRGAQRRRGRPPRRSQGDPLPAPHRPWRGALGGAGR